MRNNCNSFTSIKKFSEDARVAFKLGDESSVTVCTPEGSDYRAPNSLPSTHLPFVPYSYRSANLTAGYSSTFGGEYAKPRLGITRSLAGNAETSTWLRLRAMRPYTDELRVESELQQAELPTASPDKGPEARGEGKKESKKRKRQQQNNQD